MFRICEKYGAGFDIHLHEPGAIGALTIDMILDRVEALGMQGKAVIGHAWCLGELPYDGWIGLEYKPTTEATEDSFGWLPKGKRGGDLSVDDLNL